MIDQGYPAYRSFAVTEDNGGTIDIYRIMRGPGGELTTQDFYEHVGDGREMRPFKPAPWDVKVPQGAELFGSAAGMHTGELNMYWAGWIDAQGIHALALMQENPVTAALLPGDAPIHPPILCKDKKLRFFFWRKQGAGYALYCPVFTGELHKQGSVETQKILDIAYAPLYTVAEAIPIPFDLKNGLVEKGQAALAWLSSEGDGMRAHSLWMDGDSAILIDSDPIAGYKPLERQRIALWPDPQGVAHTAWVMVRADSDAARMGEAFQDVKSRASHLRIEARALGEAKKIHSAACLVPRRHEEALADCYVLTQTGNLHNQYDGRLKKIRSDVPLDYDFPIFSSCVQEYEARFDEKGGIVFTTP